MKKIIVFFILSFSFLLFAQETRFIEVTGTANIEYPADQINWKVSIKKIEDTFSESKNDTEAALKELVEILNINGIDKNDIQISPLQQGRHYDYDGRSRIFKGFFANIDVNFLLRDLAKYSDVIMKLSETDEFTYMIPSWTDSKYEEHHKNTLIQASDNAKNKAAYLAENLGMQIGSVLDIQEGNTTTARYPNPFNTSTSLQYEIPTASGKISYTRSIKIKFELKEK